jgi:hypothetical protein
MMPLVPINYLAVLVSAVVMMVLGALWYGPIFGKQWARMMGFTPEKMAEAQKRSMAKSYILMALGALVMSFVLAHAVIFANAYLNMGGASAGLAVGFANWIGFIAPVSLGTVLWEGKSWKLWMINSGYYLVGLLIIGVILAVWM